MPGRSERRLSPASYSEGKVPALRRPRRGEEAGREVARGRARPAGAGLGAGGERSRRRRARRRAAVRARRGPTRSGHRERARRGRGQRRRASPSRSRARSLALPQALPLPPASTHRHTPHVSTAASQPHALTCISLTSHLMAAGGAGRAPAGGSQGGEDAARDAPSARRGGGRSDPRGHRSWGGRRGHRRRPRAARSRPG